MRFESNPTLRQVFGAALLVALAVACRTGEREAASLPELDPPALPGAASTRLAALGLTPRGREAYEVLRTTGRFTDDAIYAGGETPEEVHALRLLWSEPQAAAAFAALLEEAGIGGRLYALCGLYYADRAAFDVAIETWRGTPATVGYQTGCSFLSDQSVADLIESRHPGAVRLTRAGQTIKEWVQANAPLVDEGGYRLDIIGGAIPNEFRAGGGYYTPEIPR